MLEIAEVPQRPPGAGEVCVAVAAAGLNRADLLQRRGLYPPPADAPADVPGLEYAGTIAAVGEDVREFSVGDRVMGLVGGGAMRTALVVHHREVMRMPEGMSFEEAAAVPEAFVTVWDALFLQADLTPGETALLHAAASGVGTAAMQLCRAAGVRTIGTARTASKLAQVKPLGLDEGVVAQDGRFADAVLALTGPRGVDVVLDPVGHAYFEDNLRALAPCGRLVLLGLMGGAFGELSLAPILMKRLKILGTVLRSRPHEEKAQLTQSFARVVLPMFGRGLLRPVVDAVMPMHAIREAHARMERNDTVGKLVLTW